MARAYLGLGSNLGDRLANLQRAVALLGARPEIAVVRSSRVYETEPVGGPPQPLYLNAVIEVDTELSPADLLSACLAVEADMGRVRSERWGPRVADLDVLTFGRERIREADLVVPHPRMLERGFVLVPLLELDPSLEIPGVGRPAGRRLTADLSGVRLFAPPLEVGAASPQTTGRG